MNLDETHHAIKKGDLLAPRPALATGLDPDNAAIVGWTLLMHAADGGNTSIGELPWGIVSRESPQ